MWATLRQRDFALLWFAGLISITGNWMLGIALQVLVYQMTGSALAVGGMLVANVLPGILFGSVAGVFVDRWERRRTIVMVNLLLALTLLPLLLVRSADWLWLVYVVGFVQSTLGHFFAPAENAMLPLLSDPDLLVSANALNALNNNLARLIGPAVGGIIMAASGVNGVVIIDAFTFVVAAGLSALISVTSHPGKDRPASNSISPRRIAAEWRESLHVIWRERNTRVLFLVSALPAIGEATIFVLYVAFVTKILHGDSIHVGGLMSAQAVGGIVGGMVIGWVAERVMTVRLLGVSAVLFGLVDLALFNYSTFITGIAIAYGLIALAGPLAVGIGASYNTLLQASVEDAYRGRVFGTIGLTSSVFMLVGVAFAGAAGDTLGIVPAINVQGYVYILTGVICLLALREERHASGSDTDLSDHGTN